LIQAKLINPTVTVGNTTLTFPVDIESGNYLEFRAMDDCKLYGKDGAMLAEITPVGEAPQLAHGPNTVTMECGSSSGGNPRAYVTVMARGEVVK
jgi:hypothetical protein